MPSSVPSRALFAPLTVCNDSEKIICEVFADHWLLQRRLLEVMRYPILSSYQTRAMYPTRVGELKRSLSTFLLGRFGNKFRLGTSAGYRNFRHELRQILPLIYREYRRLGG